MSITKKSEKKIARATQRSKATPKRLAIDFHPSLNGTYKVRFDERSLDAGFAVLLKGGLFHRFPDGFVITKNHLDLLKDEEIPFKIVKRTK
ncbi:MAG: hypothetical protein ACKVRN_09570 [Pyrinomonadaceae bacterium]